MGHANNAVYLTYLEEARFSHWRALGMAGQGEDHVEKGPGGIAADIPSVILARVEIDYRRPAKYGDMLDIRLCVSGLGRTSFTYEYEIVDSAARIVATAKTVLVHFDYGTNKPIPLTDSLKDALTRDLR